ncbi:MAG: NUDIX hydrolase [Candidatus Vogelbacteria bacterium]|nr:NUDIX hydrolase [Candidatus Vogelbacteria bacterium]
MDKKEFFQKIWSEWLTVDTVIFTVDQGDLKVLLTKRSNDPFRGMWALPGGFLQKNEQLGVAAARVLKEKTDVKNIYLEQLYTFDKKGRDPRGDVITVSYVALAPIEGLKSVDLNINEVQLFSVDKLPKLAFDHKEIIEYAKVRLQYKLEYTNVVYSLLPKEFTLSQLQAVYEAIFGKGLDKRNFLKKYLSLGFLKSTEKLFVGGRQRPAKLYQFTSRKPTSLKKFF